MLFERPKNHVSILSSPNLLFANDCLIFGRASSKAVRNISNVLQNFSSASRQQINRDKSNVYFSSKVDAYVKVSISNILGIQNRNSIGRYLGIHNIIFWKDPQNAKELLIKISKRLSG